MSTSDEVLERYSISRDIYETRVLAALEKAESEGRVAWRPDDGQPTYQGLWTLLASNGYHVSDDALEKCIKGRFNYLDVRDVISLSNIPLEVIF